MVEHSVNNAVKDGALLTNKELVGFSFGGAGAFSVPGVGVNAGVGAFGAPWVGFIGGRFSGAPSFGSRAFIFTLIQRGSSAGVFAFFPFPFLLSLHFLFLFLCLAAVRFFFRHGARLRVLT